MAKRTNLLSLLLFILILTAICYSAGISGNFNLDDGANIRLNSALHIHSLTPQTLWQAATSSSAGPLGRPISTLTFALNYYFSGLDATYYKITNLGIHLANGVVIFLLSRLLLGLHLRLRNKEDLQKASLFGLATASLWLLHPFNLTSVIYVVQRMTSLSAFFVLCALSAYVYGRQKLVDGNKYALFWISVAFFLFTPIAMLCKETGALTPLFIFITETTLLRWTTPRKEWSHWLIIFVGLAAAAPIIFGTLYLLKHFEILMGGYVWRDFTLIERLMTEARALWFYIHMTLVPALSEMGLHHDDFLISRGLLLPWTTLPAASGILALVSAAFLLRNKHPLITFGIYFFLIGHALEGTIIPLEIVFEHRNYLPMIGILLPLSYYALNAEFHFSSIRLRRPAFILMIALFASLTTVRAHQWGNTLAMRTLEVEHHQGSVRAHIDLAILYDYLPPTSQKDAIDLYQKARLHYQQAADIGTSSISGLIGILAMNTRRGIPIEESLLASLEQRLSTVPFGPPNMNTLIGLARDIAKGNIVIKQDIIDRLFRSAISNPRLTIADRNQIILEFGRLPPEIRPKLGNQGSPLY